MLVMANVTSNVIISHCKITKATYTMFKLMCASLCSVNCTTTCEFTSCKLHLTS